MEIASPVILLIHGLPFRWIVTIVLGATVLTGGCSILDRGQSVLNPKPQATALADPQTKAQTSTQVKTQAKTQAKQQVKTQAKAAPLSPAQSKAMAFNNQGVGKIANANYQGAIQDLNQAIKWNSKLAEAYLNRGIAYSSLDNSTAAFKDFNAAIKLNRTFALAYLNRADEYVKLGNRTQAIADLRKATDLLTKQGDSANAQVAKASLQQLENPNAENSNASTLLASASDSTPSMPRSAELTLVQHLNKINAKMYGTYWCSACNWQKELFREGRHQFNYIECDPRGTTPQPDRCDAAGIEAYPTWEINGEYRRGGLSLEELADLSGYQGPRNFSE